MAGPARRRKRPTLNDPFGDRYRYPYTLLDEGALARRGFWRGRVVDAQHFDDRFKRLADLAPIADGLTFLRGRYQYRPDNACPHCGHDFAPAKTTSETSRESTMPAAG